MIRLSALLLVTCLVLLSACSRKPELVPYVGEVARVQNVFVATTRRGEGRTLASFGGERSDQTYYASFKISVPPNRKPGEIRLPRYRPDPAREFLMVGEHLEHDKAEFVRDIDKSLAGFAPEDRTIVLFVHGFNVSFPGAVLRSAQIAEDFNVGGPMVLFSWPSAGKLTHYVYDRDSVLHARESLADLLSTLSETKARSVLILAHSMGGLLTMEAMRTLENSGKDSAIRKISAVVMAEPDIDVDVFRAQLGTFDLRSMAIVVIGSHHDRALKLSSWVAGGHPRVGSGENIEEMRSLGVILIDVSGASDGSLAQHNAFSRTPELVKLIGSGELARSVLSGDAGEDILLGSLTAAGNAAIAIAHLPYMFAP